MSNAPASCADGEGARPAAKLCCVLSSCCGPSTHAFLALYSLIGCDRLAERIAVANRATPTPPVLGLTMSAVPLTARQGWCVSSTARAHHQAQQQPQQTSASQSHLDRRRRPRAVTTAANSGTAASQAGGSAAAREADITKDYLAWAQQSGASLIPTAPASRTPAGASEPAGLPAMRRVAPPCPHPAASSTSESLGPSPMPSAPSRQAFCRPR